MAASAVPVREKMVHHFRLTRQRPLQGKLHRQRLLKRSRRNPQGLHREVAFVERGHELATQRDERHQTDREHENSACKYGTWPRDRDADDRFDLAAHVTDEASFMLAIMSVFMLMFMFLLRGMFGLGLGFSHEQRRHRRYKGERQDECTDQGKHEGRRHGLEGLALDAFQREDRCEYQ